MSSEQFVAVGLLTRRDLEVLGSGSRQAFPLDETTDFTALLELIDQVDRSVRRCSELPPVRPVDTSASGLQPGASRQPRAIVGSREPDSPNEVH